MKKNKSALTPLLLGAVLILVIFGAVQLYNYAAPQADTNVLTVVQPTDPQPEQTPGASTTPVPEVSPEPEPTPEPEPEPEPVPEPEPTPEQEEETDPDAILAPEFTVYDRQGNPVSFSQFKGKPIVLNFWASWCGPCKREMPTFEAAYKELGDKVQFLMINATDGYQETLSSATAYIDSTGYTFPVFYDTQQNALNTYGIYAFPTTFFINEKGELVVHAVSALSADALQQGINLILPKEES